MQRIAYFQGVARDDLSEVAVAAALAVASGEGLRAREPRVVGRGSNRIIWLWPAPIVARVMTGTAVLHADPRAWLGREIDVGTFLAGTGAPTVAPASIIDPGPHVTGGVWLSFWEHVEVIAADVSAGEVGCSLTSLHDALARYSGELPPRSAVLDEIDWLLGALADESGLGALLEERDRLAPLLRQVDAGGQPLHGDASLSNLLSTTADRAGTTSRTCASARQHGTSSGSSTTHVSPGAKCSRPTCWRPTGVTSTRR
jgi:hypothetical protein